MSEEIIKVLDELSKKFGIAIDWTSENVMPYIEELCKKFINYEIVTSIFWIGFFAILFVIALVVGVKATKKANESNWNEESWYWLAIIGIAVSIVSGAAVCLALPEQGIDIVTCITFPEKAIFEYVTTLL